MKNIIQRQMPLDVNYSIVGKKYIPLIEGYGCTCDNCGKLIANIAEVRNPSGKMYNIGFDCLETFLINNNLLSKGDIEQYEEIKAAIPKILNAAKKLKELIKSNRERGIMVNGMEFNKPVPDFYCYSFNWLADGCRPYNDYIKVNKVNFDFFMETIRSIFPSLNITVKP